MTEITNAPDLRFPEFNDKWQMMNLSNIVTTIKGNDNQIDLPILTISAKYGWLTQKERFSQVIAGNSLKRYTKVSRGDLSYNKGNSKIAKYGIVYKMNYDEALVPNVYKSFRPHKGINSSFIEKYFHTKKLDRQLRKYISSTARMDGLLNISDNDFYKVNIYIPNSFEQEKIGDFFSKLDRQIELEEKKLELFEQQKRGYMQKLFSQELRFKDEIGKVYPKWNLKKLKDIANVYQPQNLSQNKFQEKGYPVYGANGVIGYYKEFNHSNMEIAIACRGNTCGRVNLTEPKSWITSNAMVVNIIDKKEIDFYFLYQYLRIINYNNVISGSGQPQITRKNMNSIELLVPKYVEQQKIGAFLTKYEELIKKQSSKVGLLKRRKQGLLQKMFV